MKKINFDESITSSMAQQLDEKEAAYVASFDWVHPERWLSPGSTPKKCAFCGGILLLLYTAVAEDYVAGTDTFTCPLCEKVNVEKSREAEELDAESAEAPTCPACGELQENGAIVWEGWSMKQICSCGHKFN